MKVVLVGYMGSGKTSVGRELASKLNYAFVDLDDFIEASEEMSVSQLFSEKGEIYFRKKENQYLKELVRSEEKIVLATGGGTPCYGDSMDFLISEEKCVTVYLKTSNAVLSERLFLERNHRPLISHLENEQLLNDFIRKHLFERVFYYNKAEIVVDTDQQSPQEISEAIVVRLF
ncbi:shikimate kinase [Ulvibacter antarcticus]|uniref:Shikimate kinase n=1 Tax=Ulvibacter antarcticus TaxID=442714 RepID=A0A3L9Y9R1_9FLAO|nr:shikimate kinase [Ulvibacter antarcticus]RMA56257.1 shikimate kinase [Ulvibacter antarcticus]